MKSADERAIRKRLRRLESKAEEEIIDQAWSELTEEERNLIHTTIARPEMKRLDDGGPDTPELEAKYDALLATLPSNEQAAFKKVKARTLELEKQRGITTLA